MKAGPLVLVQAALAGLAIALVDLTRYQAASKWLAYGVLGWWFVLAGGYVLGRSRNREPRNGRGWKAETLVAGTSVALAAGALIVHWAHDSELWRGKPVGIGVLAVASLGVALFASYLVDWYYVLPRRDGLVGDPPCRGTKDWTGVTRIWYTHRALAGIIGAGAVVVATTAFTFAAFNLPKATGGSDKAASVLLAAAASGLALTRLLYGNLTTIGEVFSRCCLSAPDVALGDRLTGPADFKGGYVRDVSLEGISVVRLDRQDRPEGGIWRLKRHSIAHVLDSTEIEGRPFAPCRVTCQLINADCQWREPTTKRNSPSRNREGEPN